MQDLIAKVNNKLAESELFYISNDPERALGLENILDNYHIVHIDTSQYINYFNDNNVNFFCLDDKLKQDEDIYRSSIKLIKHPLFTEYYQAHKSDKQNYIQTFKISPAFEKSVYGLGANLVNTNSNLNRLFENKLSQFEKLSYLDINLPKGKLIELETADYQELVSEFGENFVVQYDRGHTGGGTFFITSDAELGKLKAQTPRRTVKVSTYIKGLPYTLNACVTKHGIAMGGLSYQITGYQELTSSAGGTVGNDFSYRELITNSTLEKITSDVTIIGLEMQKHGYKGLFGIDLIVDEQNQPWIIEINARQPASIPMYTKIQLKQAIAPLSLLHLAEFLEIDYDLNLQEYNRNSLADAEYSQVFIRAQKELRLMGYVETGIYRLLSDNSAINRLDDSVTPGTVFLDEDRDKPLVKQTTGYTLDDLDQQDGILVLASEKGKLIKPGQEIARIQVASTVLDSNGKLKGWVIESLKAIKDYQL